MQYGGVVGKRYLSGKVPSIYQIGVRGGVTISLAPESIYDGSGIMIYFTRLQT